MLTAVYNLESVPLLYLVLSCAIVALSVKSKLFYDSRQIQNNATYAKTTQRDMWKHCLVGNVEAYLSRRQILLQSRFESLGCQIMNSQWKEAAADPVTSMVVVMTVDLTNSVIKVCKYNGMFKIFHQNCNNAVLQCIIITEIVRIDRKDSKTTPIETLVSYRASHYSVHNMTFLHLMYDQSVAWDEKGMLLRRRPRHRRRERADNIYSRQIRTGEAGRRPIV